MSNIFKKISEAKKKFGSIRKDGINPHFKSKYATIDNVIAVIDPVLEEVGLTYYITQTREMSSKLFVVDIESGEKVESESPILLGKQDMQQLGSAYTYNRRYLLVTFFGLEQEDDDGNKASGYTQKPQQKQEPKPQPKEIIKINQEQVKELESLFTSDEHKASFLAKAKISKLEDMPLSWFEKAKESLK